MLNFFNGGMHEVFCSSSAYVSVKTWCWVQTSENVVLVVMICLSTHFNETRQTLGDDKLWNQVLIILFKIKQNPDLLRCTTAYDVMNYSSRRLGSALIWVYMVYACTISINVDCISIAVLLWDTSSRFNFVLNFPHNLESNVITVNVEEIKFVTISVQSVLTLTICNISSSLSNSLTYSFFSLKNLFVCFSWSYLKELL